MRSAVQRTRPSRPSMWAATANSRRPRAYVAHTSIPEVCAFCVCDCEPGTVTWTVRTWAAFAGRRRDLASRVTCSSGPVASRADNVAGERRPSIASSTATRTPRAARSASAWEMGTGAPGAGARPAEPDDAQGRASAGGELGGATAVGAEGPHGAGSRWARNSSEPVSTSHSGSQGTARSTTPMPSGAEGVAASAMCADMRPPMLLRRPALQSSRVCLPMLVPGERGMGTLHLGHGRSDVMGDGFVTWDNRTASGSGTSANAHRGAGGDPGACSPNQSSIKLWACED